MLTRHKLNTILTVLSPRLHEQGLVLDGELLSRAALQPQRQSVLSESDHNIGVVPIHGSLVHRSMGVDALSGLSTYAAIESQFMAALEDDSVSHIVLDIDSPGGEVNGVFDLVDRIYDARSIKSITALINESGFSAAYALASAAHQIIVPRTAGVGSIGVIAAHVDQSAQDQQQGLNITTVFAGDRKNDLNPHAPLSDDAQHQLQQQVDDTYDLFVDTVARNRGLSTLVIKDTQAGLFFGSAAVDIGLADTVSPIHHALTHLHEVTFMSGHTENTLTAQHETSATMQPASAAEQEMARLQLESEIEERLTQSLTATILSAERKRVAGIFNACQTMNRLDRVMALIEKGETVEAASHQLLNTMASESEHSQVLSTVTPYPNASEENPLIQNAKQRATSVAA